MRTRAKLVLTSLTAALMLAALVGTATATRLEISNQSIRVTWARLRFSNQVAAGGVEAICPVTLEGTFHSRTIIKRPELLIGYVTRAIVNNAAPPCTYSGGAELVTIQTTSLPWHIRYEGFTGTLPRITGKILRLVLASFILRAFGVNCLYRSTVANPARGTAVVNSATGQITSLRAQPETTIPRFEGSFLCPASGIFEGEGQVRLQGSSTTLIFVRLI